MHVLLCIHIQCTFLQNEETIMSFFTLHYLIHWSSCSIWIFQLWNLHFLSIWLILKFCVLSICYTQYVQLSKYVNWISNSSIYHNLEERNGNLFCLCSVVYTQIPVVLFDTYCYIDFCIYLYAYLYDAPWGYNSIFVFCMLGAIPMSEMSMSGLLWCS